MVVGVTQGFERKLQLVGVGYVPPSRAMLLRWHWASPPVEHALPAGVPLNVRPPPGDRSAWCDKQLVGQGSPPISVLTALRSPTRAGVYAMRQRASRVLKKPRRSKVTLWTRKSARLRGHSCSEKMQELGATRLVVHRTRVISMLRLSQPTVPKFWPLLPR